MTNFMLMLSQLLYIKTLSSKIPTQKFSGSKEVRWGLTARKSPIGVG